MKALHADPKTVRRVFAERYTIPDFQRPYSWETEQCEKLWDDIELFYNEHRSKEDKYFLGNLVVHQDGESLAVIDGQQRLTTLLLLIKALHQRAGVVKALEECLKLKDPLTSELIDELRIISHVIAKDKEHLLDIVFGNGENSDPESKLKQSYSTLSGKVDQWWRSCGQSTDRLNTLILLLLDQVVLLPIHCGSEDDALTIFETINNRGMSLTDADIFKAKLHKNSGHERDKFILEWNALNNPEWLFRIYMHLRRADANDSGKEMALRSYFAGKDSLRNWNDVMRSLKLIHEVENNWEANDKVEILWSILHTYPNYYWNFPLFVYLHKHGSMTSEGFTIPPTLNSDFTNLVEETFRYFFLKGVVHNSVNAVKDTAFKVCAAIAQGDDYSSEYKKSIGDDRLEFKRRLENRQYGRYLNGLVLLAGYLNPAQDAKDYKTALKGNCHVEHILPKKWNNYDKWTAETWEANLNTLGNLTPLEWNLNISARNEFFLKKKEQYFKSKIQDAVDLIAISDWHPLDYEQRHQVVEKRITDFIIERV
jgi:Protein of unknown function DUF262/Protein of unknown function (DUF1524)